MNKIQLTLDVTPQQLTAIAAVLNDETPAPVVVSSTPVTEPETTVADAGSMFAESDAAIAAGKPLAEVPPAPSVTEPAASAPTAEVELGKGLNGQMIPWDARIHGNAKKKNADGSWRLKQGIDRVTMVPQVEAELMAAMGASADPKPATSTTGSTSSQQAAPQSVQNVDQSPTPSASVSVEVPAPPAAADVPPPPAASPTTFAELLPLVTAAKAAGTLTDEKINEVSAALGLAQFGLIATRPDLIPQMAESLGV